MKIEEIVNPGYGFRLLKKREVIPITAEWIGPDGWGKDLNALTDAPYGKNYTRGGLYRVPIEMEPGWELVPKECVAGCVQPKGLFEYLRHDDEPTAWTTIAYSSHTGEQWAKDPNILAFRRRKPEPVKEVNVAAEKREYYRLFNFVPMTESEAPEELKRLATETDKTISLVRIVSKFEFQPAKPAELKETKL